MSLFIFAQFLFINFWISVSRFIAIGVGVGKFMGVKRIFARIFPNLPEKYFVRLLPANFLPQRWWRPYFGVPPKTGLVFFCKRWAPFFPGFSRILPRFSRIFFEFLTNQNCWGCACTPASCATVYSKWVGNTQKYENINSSHSTNEALCA